jgi:hypothetical protein
VSVVQVVHAVHAVRFADAVKKPALHEEQTWFVVAVPAVLTYWPAGHAVYVVQLGAFVVSLNEPVAHAPQIRFVVVVPAVVIEVPAAQSAHGTHAVEALASESHVPLAHGVAGSTPPGQ